MVPFLDLLDGGDVDAAFLSLDLTDGSMGNGIELLVETAALMEALGE